MGIRRQCSESSYHWRDQRRHLCSSVGGCTFCALALSKRFDRCRRRARDPRCAHQERPWRRGLFVSEARLPGWPVRRTTARSSWSDVHVQGRPCYRSCFTAIRASRSRQNTVPPSGISTAASVRGPRGAAQQAGSREVHHRTRPPVPQSRPRPQGDRQSDRRWAAHAWIGDRHRPARLCRAFCAPALGREAARILPPHRRAHACLPGGADHPHRARPA